MSSSSRGWRMSVGYIVQDDISLMRYNSLLTCRYHWQNHSKIFSPVGSRLRHQVPVYIFLQKHKRFRYNFRCTFFYKSSNGLNTLDTNSNAMYSFKCKPFQLWGAFFVRWCLSNFKTGSPDQFWRNAGTLGKFWIRSLGFMHFSNTRILPQFDSLMSVS